MIFFFQRGEKELQEKAEATQLPAKREVGDSVETEPSPAVPAQAAANNQQQFSFQLPDQPGLGSNNNVNTETVIQNINNLSLTGQSNRANHLQTNNVKSSRRSESGQHPTQ